MVLGNSMLVLDSPSFIGYTKYNSLVSKFTYAGRNLSVIDRFSKFFIKNLSESIFSYINNFIYIFIFYIKYIYIIYHFD